ncbi:MAG: hypothetical protein K9M36_01355 [Candidatus Pacebacteria bacterium]|nr:hypothetical protein [Candidatus Paceibacterota bacterium]
MDPVTQESTKNTTWAWAVMGIIVLLAIFLWIRGANVSDQEDMYAVEDTETIAEQDASDESTEVLEVELESMDFAELDADLAELEEME